MNPLHRLERMIGGMLSLIETLVPAQAVDVARGRDFDAAGRKAGEALVGALDDPDDGGEALEPGGTPLTAQQFTFDLRQHVAAALYRAVCESGAYAERAKDGEPIVGWFCVDGDIDYEDLADAAIESLTDLFGVRTPDTL